MAYRYEKRENGEQDLVIDGFEKGIAVSPFKGIGNIRNLNVKYYEGVSYVNYKRQRATINNANGVSSQTFTVTVASPAVFTSTSHGLAANETIEFTTTGALPTGLSTGVTYYVISAGLGADTFEVALTRGGSAINTTGTQSGTHTFTVVITKPVCSAQSPAGIIYIVDDNRNIWKQTAVNGAIFQHLTGNNANQDISGISFWNNYLITIGEDSGARVEICGNGAGDSGVTSSNWNNTQATNNFTVTIPAASGTCTISNADPAVVSKVGHGFSIGQPVRFTTTGGLPSPLVVGTTYYIISAGFGVDNFEISTSAGGTAVATTTAGSGTHTVRGIGVFTLTSHGLSSGDRIRLSTDGALPTGLVTNVDYYVMDGVTADTFLVSSTSPSSTGIATSGSQSGTHTLTYLTGLWPIINGVTITLSTPAVEGDTSASGFSYSDSGGTTRNFWNGPSGFYNLEFLLPTFGGGTQVVLAQFTQGSSNILWTPALNATPTGSTATLFFNSNIVASANVSHNTLIASNTGDMYFCNGPNIGAVTQNPDQKFNKSDMHTFTFYSNILSLPTYETSTWLTELNSNLIVLGQYKLYPWNFFSPGWDTPVPIDEKIIKGINILNNVYIFAGVKGNIYISNGYSISRFAKLPDYISGVIDPSWFIGGIMQHRQKVEFQAMAVNGQTGATIFAGVFSLDLDTSALAMENEYSGGLAPSGLTSNGILVDISTTAINYDKYYSAYSATVSRIEFNDTTLYSNNEPMIETDIIPVGTYLQKKTYGSAEFKLDQPLQSGDSISLYFRQSLADAYTLIGTTTDAVLSFSEQKLSLQEFQWIQFKATFSCNPTATSSSFNRLRELRIR